jgi:CubicO group peptidase (beta-lactamase class C family)
MQSSLASLAALAACAWSWCGCAASVAGAARRIEGDARVPQLETAQATRAAELQAALLAGMETGRVAGAVALVGRGEGTLAFAAAGLRSVQPRAEAANRDTVWDLASLTKPLATASCVLALVDAGILVLDAPVARWLPEFGEAGKESITVEHLLRHASGLPAANPMDDYARGPDEAWRCICASTTSSRPGARRVYSDVGYIVLGKLVERVDGGSLEDSVHRRVLEPCGMRTACFNPGEGLLERCAPTEANGGSMLRGSVHDPRARALGGVAGHAGLFGTVDDVARWCRMVLRGGDSDGVRVLSAQACRLLLEPSALEPGSAPRTIALDADPGNAARGGSFPAGTSCGHTGFTGGSLWLDPATRGFVVVLSSRLHPDGQGDAKPLRRASAEAAWRMLASE